MLFENKAKEEVIRSFLEAKQQEEEQRKNLAAERLMIFNDQWDKLLDQRLRSQFVAENYVRAKIALDTSQNLLKRVITEISMIYKKAPTRVFSDKNNYFEDINLDQAMKLVNKYFNLVNDVGVMFLYREDVDRTEPMILTPAVTSVIQKQNNLNECEALIYEVEKGDTPGDSKKLFVYWDDEDHYYFDSDLKVYPPENNPDMVNPYGKIPIVWFHKDQIPGQFWNIHGNNGLKEGGLWNGVLKTLKKYHMKNFIKQPWGTGLDDTKEKTMDPLSLWCLDEGAQMGTLDMGIDLEKFDAGIDKDANDCISDFGLSVSMFSLGPEQMSGRALQIKNRALDEIRSDQIPIFRKKEFEMFEIFRMVENYHNKNRVPESVELLKVDFVELDNYISEEERKDADWVDVNRGTLSLAEYYQRRNPDASIEEAEQKIKENIKKLQELKKTGLTFDNLFDDDGGENEGESQAV